jgi:hypothetical protein
VHLVYERCDAWLGKDRLMLTPIGKMKRTSVSIIDEWISKAWKEVPVSIIPESFLKHNLEDRTQDDRNMHIVKILNFHVIQVYYPVPYFEYALNVLF